MHGGHAPTIRRAKSKPPSAAAVAASAVQQQVQQLCCKWELSAVSHGSSDPAAQLQAAKTLQQLVQYLSQHKSTCKQGATRSLLQKHLPPELLLALLSSQQQEVVNLSLYVLHDLAHIVPAVVPVDAAPRLLQLLCCQTYGGAAAQVLTAQLSNWRFSQVWPHWTAASTTHRLYQQLQQQLALAQAPESAGSNTASKAAEACVSMLMLLAKLVKLAEQQVLWQLAPDAGSASRWLQLLLQVAGLRSQLAGRPTCAQLQDSCCALLAALSQAPTTSAVLTSSRHVRQGVLQLLHGVLRRPCCVSEADASQVQCWMHAAAAASLAVLWQQPQLQEQPQQQQQQNGSVLAPHEEQQLLADMAISAAATLCNECFSVSAIAKQVDGAAASLLAVALLPSEGAYGRHGSCTSRFMAAVLGSHCCHVLLHALAVSTNTTSEQAAALAAAAAAATVSAAHASTQAISSPAVSDEQPAQAGVAGGALDTAQSVILAPVQQGLQPAWLLLRLICAQCAAVADGTAAAAAVGTRSSAAPLGVCEVPRSKGSSNGAARGPRTHVKQQMSLLVSCSSGGSAVQPEQVLRVVQAYSSHITAGTDAQRMPGLLRSLHFLMCQFVLVVRRGPSTSQHDAGSTGKLHQDRQQEHGRQRLQWMSLTTDGASSSCSSNSDSEAAHIGTGQQQMLSTAAAVLGLITSSQQGLLSVGPGSHGSGSNSSTPAAASSSSRALSPHQLSWSLAASVYVSLAVAVYLQERSTVAGSSGDAAAGAGHLSAADCCLALGAVQLATAALKVLLPVVTVLKCRSSTGAGATAAAASAVQDQQPKAGQQQRKALVLPVHEPLECSLAAVQVLTALSALLQPALPGLLSDCISSGTGYIGHQYAPASHDNSGSSSNGSHTTGGANNVVRVPAVKAAVAAAAAGFDKDLQSLLSRVVLSWQSSPNDSNAASTHSSPSTAAAQLSVDAALQQHLQQELRCWSAAALALCYGQMGAQTWQGTVLEPFRDPGAPFADVQLQLGPNQHVTGHAAVLAAGCPVLRQQLAAAVADAAGDGSTGQQPPHTTALQGSSSSSGCSSGMSGRAGKSLLLKLSAAVNLQAFQQTLDFVYTGATTLPHAGLASQLQLCSSCLSPSADRQRPLDKLRALQQRQLQELQEQQAATRQQLQKLGMLARKLQLPLLAALTRGRRPEPGQKLPDLHLDFAALLPQQVLLSAPSSCRQKQQPAAAAAAVLVTSTASCSGAVSAPVDGQQAQQHLQQHGDATLQLTSWATGADWQEQQQQQAANRHPTNTDYLAMLACAAADSSGIAAPQLSNGAAAGHLGLNAPHSRNLQQLLDALQLQRQAVAQDHSFADVFIAAPVMLAASSSQQQHLQQQDPGCQLQSEVAFAFLPAHRVMLSSCCPYFEALLSTRWQHDDDFVPRSSSVQGSGAAAAAHQQGQQHAAHVVVVPEADIHVAAALQHYLYTGSLRVELPQQVVSVAAGTARPSCASLFNVQQEKEQQQQHQASRQHETLQGSGVTCGAIGASAGLQSGAAAAAAAAAGIPLNGCCQGCHQARTLLRLWRCAELLLLPSLQALCLAAVDAAGWQLDLQCCLVLLGDCCELGVPPAADALLAALSVRAERDAAAALCEWEELPAGLQAVLIKAWADRRRLQQDGAAVGLAGGQAGVIGATASATAGQGPTTAYGGAAGGLPPQRGVRHTGVLPADAGVLGLVGMEQELQPPVLLLQTQQLGMPYEPVVVPWRCVQDLIDAGQGLSDALSLQHKHSRA